MRKAALAMTAATIALLSLASCSAGVSSRSDRQPRSVTAFVASSGRQAMEAAAAAFEAKAGVKVYLNLGASGNLLAQMKIARSGDLFFPASPDFMEAAVKDGLVDASSEVKIGYLVPAILVPGGNPRGIAALSDLSRPGLKLAIADPRTVPAGRFAYEIMERNGLVAVISGNVATYAESYEKLVSLVILRSVDGALGWDIVARQRPRELGAVYLPPDQIPRLSYVSGAVARFTIDRESAAAFLRFLASPEGQELLRRNGYYTEIEARRLAPSAQVGGKYQLPADYEPLVR